MSSELLTQVAGPVSYGAERANTAKGSVSTDSVRKESTESVTPSAEPVTVSANDSPTSGPSSNAKQIDSAVKDLNEYVQNIRRDLQFRVDEDSGRTVITVIDAASKKVVRQIPPEEVLNIVRNLGEPGDGMLLKTSA